MSCVVDSQTVSRMRSPLAVSVWPVSVSSTMPSTSPARTFPSVAPHENSTSARTPCLAR